MNNGYLKLTSSDFLKGAITAFLSGLIFAIAGVMGTPGFDLFQANWSAILSSALNASIAGLVGYLSKGLLTNSDGAVMGMASTKPRS